VDAHAALWFGTPESRIDLALATSSALAVRGNMQTGWVQVQSTYHAAIWRGNAASFVDLHPLGASSSYTYATDGVLQGGVAWYAIPNGTQSHAAIWNGTAQSYLDLSPGGRDAYIHGMVPGVQVGRVFINAAHADHAALWHGTAASWIDLHPAAAVAGASRFNATTGTIHVGQGRVDGTGGIEGALINFGTPTSWVNLYDYLPPGYNSGSVAHAVYQDGGTIYVAGFAVRDSTGEREAFLWIGHVPCYSNCDQSTASPALNANDFQCFLNKFAAADAVANCDESTAAPVLNVNDFMCFLNKFAAGCT